MAAPEIFTVNRTTRFPDPEQQWTESRNVNWKEHQGSSIESNALFCNDTAGHPIDATQAWLPIALRRKTLVAFMTVYLILIIVLAVLFDYSNKHNGVASSRANLYYLWTYGPTAGEHMVPTLMRRTNLA
jgi:tryptophan-rich sensory protein